MKVYRSIAEPIRQEPSWDQRWGTVALGLITSWERGQEKSVEDPELAAQARSGQLVPLAWKGGVEKAILKKSKYVVFNYLAMWQGLRGDDLDIDPDEEISLTCTVTMMVVVFTSDFSKYANA